MTAPARAWVAPLARSWMEMELERIWLTAEGELRRLQALGLRQPPSSPAIADVEAVLAERRAARAGKLVPLETAELERALDEISQRLEPLRRPAIEQLTSRLGLSAGDVEGLLIVAAPAIDPSLADLFTIVRGPLMSRRGVDVALIGQLLSHRRKQRVDLLGLIDENRAPVEKRLIQVAPTQDVYSSASYRSIQPTLDLLWILTGQPGPSPSLRRQAALLQAPASFDGLILDADTRSGLGFFADRYRHAPEALPWLALWGPKGAGKKEIASRLAAFSGRPLYAVDPRSTDKAQLGDLLRRACRDAEWLGAALYLGPIVDEELPPAAIHELVACRAPLMLGAEGLQAPRVKTPHPLAECPLPVPLTPARRELWARELAKVDHDVDLSTLANGYKITPGEILESAREAISLAGGRPVDDELVRGIMERRLRNELGQVATRLVVNTSWEDVILPAEATGRVHELIARKRYEDKVYREWGLGEKISYGRGLIALFSGPPGTGKTLLAGLIARELGFELYQVDLSQIFSRWIGETEKALGKVFDQAERAHAVLLFDEADALFAKRTEVEDSRDRYANVAVNFLLQRLERYSGVAILTTNKDSYLDEALRRRLSLHLMLDEPEMPERLRLWQKHLPMQVPGSHTVDLAALAGEFELTGGYIKNVAVRATFLSVAEDVPLSTEHVRRAANLELEDMGRVVMWHDREGEVLAPVAADYVEG